jgi:hypothetical protein
MSTENVVDGAAGAVLSAALACPRRAWTTFTDPLGAAAVRRGSWAARVENGAPAPTHGYGARPVAADERRT